MKNTKLGENETKASIANQIKSINDDIRKEEAALAIHTANQQKVTVRMSSVTDEVTKQTKCVEENTGQSSTWKSGYAQAKAALDAKLGEIKSLYSGQTYALDELVSKFSVSISTEEWLTTAKVIVKNYLAALPADPDMLKPIIEAGDLARRRRMRRYKRKLF